MNNYREAYDKYYRNINKQSNVKIDENKNIFSIKNKERIYRDKNEVNNILSKKYWIKRANREIIGAMVLIALFGVLKYTPLEGTKNIYTKCKNLLNTTLTYDQSIDTLKSIDVGTFKGELFNMNGLTFEDFKSDNFKKEFQEAINYIKNNSFKIEEKEL
ncbi:MAG: hypothetical protein E7208_05045 [Clostridium butyricum]|nr:hypothetical protein [Clostridium butyricum]